MSFTGKKTACALLIAAAIGTGFQLARTIASTVPGGDRTPSIRWAYELQRARAHRRMENTMYASHAATRGRCLNVSRPGRRRS